MQQSDISNISNISNKDPNDEDYDYVSEHSDHAHEHSKTFVMDTQFVLPKRHRAKWSYSEIDALYREFEIKGYEIDFIAKKHERTCSAILFKLEAEGLLEDDEEGEEDDDEGEEEEEDDEEEEEDDEEEEEEEEEEDDSPACQLTVFSDSAPIAMLKVAVACCDVINAFVNVVFGAHQTLFRYVFRTPNIKRNE